MKLNMFFGIFLDSNDDVLIHIRADGIY